MTVVQFSSVVFVADVVDIIVYILACHCCNLSCPTSVRLTD